MIFHEKKVLFVCPRHYDFPRVFINQLSYLGARVIYIADIEKEAYFRIIRKAQILRKGFLKFLNRKLLKVNRKYKFDYLFVIKGSFIDPESLKVIKQDNPGIKLIMYQWDSVKNNDYTRLIPFFDIVASFDYSDVRNHEGVHYLPLFYTEEFEGWNSVGDFRNIDLFSFGVFYEDRYDYMEKIEKFARQHNLKYYFKLYISLYRLFMMMLKTGRLFYKNLTIIPLSRKKVSKIMLDSKCVIDIHHQNQTGLTMRTIESLGAGCKLLTTNPYIKEEPFYTPSVIKLIDRNDLVLDIEFILNGYNKIPFGDYSVKNFIMKLFSLTEITACDRNNK